MKKDKHQDHDYLVHIMPQIVEAQEMDVAWAASVQALNGFGFDRFLYGFTRSNTPQGAGERNDLFWLSNLPEEFLNTYVGARLYLQSAITSWALRNTAAMSWSMMQKKRATLSEAQARVIAFNQQHGISGGCTISFDHAITRKRSAIALIAPAGVEQKKIDGLWKKNGYIINTLCDVAHPKKLPLFPSPKRTNHLQKGNVKRWNGSATVKPQLISRF